MLVSRSGVFRVDRVSARGAGAVVGTLFLVLAMLYAGAGAAAAQGHEEPGSTSGSLQFSDDGTTWADTAAEALPAFGGGNLSPGNYITRTYFVRNADTRTGTFETVIGQWSASANSLFTVQSDFDGSEGETYVYYGEDITDRTYGPAVENGTVLNSVQLAPGEQVQVVDSVGIHPDAGSEAQGSRVTAAIEWSLTLPAPVEPPAECDSGAQVDGLFSAAGSVGSVSWGAALGSTSGSASVDSGCLPQAAL